MKHLLLTIAAIVCSVSQLYADGAQVRLSDSSCRLFEQGETITISADVTVEQPVRLNLTYVVRDDVGNELERRTRRVKVTSSVEGVAPLRVKGLDAGFYSVELLCEGEKVDFHKFGIDPDAVVSLPDGESDFDEFWAAARRELDAVEPCYTLTECEERSTSRRRFYYVEMQSLGGEKISGYYLEPVAEGKFPALICYLGYGSDQWIPDADATAERVEFYLSHRGQGLNKPTNKYGDWIVSGMESEHTYYYKGAYMDAVRAIDFVASRDKVNADLIFAEGGSQGGALTLAACALDDRIAAAAPFVPFMSDFPDYMNMAVWPANALKPAAEQRGIAYEEMLRVLSYFDIKNLAPNIKCPILMGFGLQDEVCPPHTNFAGYNNLAVPKRWVVFPKRGHDVHNESEWYRLREEFFAEIIHKYNNQ